MIAVVSNRQWLCSPVSACPGSQDEPELVMSSRSSLLEFPFLSSRNIPSNVGLVFRSLCKSRHCLARRERSCRVTMTKSISHAHFHTIAFDIPPSQDHRLMVCVFVGAMPQFPGPPGSGCWSACSSEPCIQICPPLLCSLYLVYLLV